MEIDTRRLNSAKWFTGIVWNKSRCQSPTFHKLEDKQWLANRGSGEQTVIGEDYVWQQPKDVYVGGYNLESVSSFKNCDDKTKNACLNGKLSWSKKCDDKTKNACLNRKLSWSKNEFRKYPELIIQLLTKLRVNWANSCHNFYDQDRLKQRWRMSRICLHLYLNLNKKISTTTQLISETSGDAPPT